MEWDEYIHRETPSVPIREPQKVTLYAVKSFYVRLDGEKVRVEGYSFNIPRWVDDHRMDRGRCLE